MILAIIGVFFATVQAILQVLFAPQIPFPVNLFVSIVIVLIVVGLLIAAFGLERLTKSRTLANFYRRPLLVILSYGAIEGMALYMLYLASYLHGLDVLVEENNLNVSQVFHISVTGVQLHNTLIFAIAEASIAVFILTFVIGYTLYMLGMDKQRALQHR